MFVEHKRRVRPRGNGGTERAINQNLPRRGFQQIRPAHDFRDAHAHIVGNDGKLIRGNAVATPHDKIAEIRSRDEFLLALKRIEKRNRFAVGNAKTPVEIARLVELRARSRRRTPLGRENRLGGFVLGVRRTCGGGNVLAGTPARINRAGIFQAFQIFKKYGKFSDCT